jgi:hypothetical protein
MGKTQINEKLRIRKDDSKISSCLDRDIKRIYVFFDALFIKTVLLK